MGDRRKSKGKGRADTRDNVSYEPSTSVSSNTRRFLIDPQQFLDEHSILEKINTATINRDSKSENFITLNSLLEIWEWDLTGFLAVLGYENNTTLVENVKVHLIKTISILVAIRWNKWDTLGELFVEPRGGGWVRHDRKDARLPYKFSELEVNSFLGISWASDFFYTQYAYIPVIVEEARGDKHAVYPRTRPLPFIRSKSKLIAIGGYGTVTKEVIACHQFLPKTNYGWGSPNPDEYEVARKRFHGKGDFRKEARNLANLNSSLSHHERIVNYLAVFIVEDEDDKHASKEFSILLPLANADLQHFLNEEAFESRCANVIDLIKEASNVAHAIRWLHEGQSINDTILVCCHMDIKLDNVLVYLDHPSPVGYWKISDFGISSMIERPDNDREPTVSRRPASVYLTVPPAESLAIITGSFKTSPKRPAGAYSAPEVKEGSQVGPKSDIWSFGCILFQVLVRGAGGRQLLKQLDDKRASFENGSRNDHFCQRNSRGVEELHPSVREWLESRNQDQLLLKSFLERTVVMNCKDLIKKTLRIEQTTRPDAVRLHKELVRLSKGDGQQYVLDRHSNMLSTPTTPQPSVNRLSPVATPYIKVTASPPESQQEAQPEATKARPSPLEMQACPPVSTSAASPRPSTAQNYTPILHSPPTPPHDIDDQDPMSTLQSKEHGHLGSKQSQPQLALASPPASDARRPSLGFPENISGQSTMNRLPPRKPLAASTNNQYRGHWPAPHTASHEQGGNSGVIPTSSIVPDPSFMPPPRRETTLDSFPRQRSRNNSAQTSVSSIPEVQVQLSVTGESMPFAVPQEVIATLISSTRAKIVFITPGAAICFTLYSPYVRKTIHPPHNCTWQKGSFAGDFLALRSASNLHSTQGLHLYKLHFSEQVLGYQEIRSETRLPNFEKFSVSRDGRLLLGKSSTVWLYHSFGSAGQELPIITTQGGKLQRVWFSTNGLLAFAWISFSGSFHRVRIWDVADTKKTGALNCQIPPSDMSASAVKTMVHFPSSPMCIVWKEHDIVSLLQNLAPANPEQIINAHQLKNLQAIVVTPNEEAIVIIRWYQPSKWKPHLKSKISIGRMDNVGERGEHRVLGSISAEQDLQYYLDKPAKCDVVIEEHTSTSTKVRVLIAHHNGNFEVKDMDLPRPNNGYN